jgi:hypothetical protein
MIDKWMAQIPAYPVVPAFYLSLVMLPQIITSVVTRRVLVVLSFFFSIFHILFPAHAISVAMAEILFATEMIVSA